MIEDIIDVIEEHTEDNVPVEEETVVINTGGTNDHSKLKKLDYASSGHTGFASSDDLTSATNNLQTQIDAITVSTDVVDVLRTYQDLQNYDTSKLTADDIVKVLQDSTHLNAMSYYKWTITQGVGAWSYVGSEGPFYTKSESDTLLQAKANTSDLSRIATTGSYADLLNNPQELFNAEVGDIVNLTDLYEGMTGNSICYICGNSFMLIVDEVEGNPYEISLNKGDLIFINNENVTSTIISATGQYFFYYDGEFWVGGFLTTKDEVIYYIDNAISQLDLSAYVDKTSNETISGVKTIQNTDGLKFHLPSSNMSSSITPLNEGMSLNYIDSNYTVQKLILGRLKTTTVQDLIPREDGTIALGNTNNKWSTVYTNNLSNGTNSISVSDIINKQNALTFDSTPTASSTNPVTSGGVFNSIQNVTEVAEGKTATYTLSYATTGNTDFNSQNASITVSSFVDSAGNTITDEDVKVGDIVLVIEVDVPDRWVQSIDTTNHTITFYKMETSKIDLNNYVDLTSAQTISGDKTFSNGITLTNGYLITTGNQIAFRFDNVSQYLVQGARISPLSSQDLGSATYKWKDLYLSRNLTDGTNQTTVAKINNNFSPRYNATATYNLGDRCIYEGVMYKCTTAITTAEDWDSTHWTATSVDDLIGNIDSALTGLVSGGGVQ